MNRLAVVLMVLAVSALASSDVFAARIRFTPNSSGEHLMTRVTNSQWGAYSIRSWTATQGSEFLFVFTDGSTETLYTGMDANQWNTVGLRNSVFNALSNQIDGRIGVYYTWNGSLSAIDTKEQYTSRTFYSNECVGVFASCYRTVQSWTEVSAVPVISSFQLFTPALALLLTMSQRRT